MNKNDYRGNIRRKISQSLMNNPTLRNKSVFDTMRFKIYLSNKSFSYIEYNRALDDLVTKEIEPFSWRDNDAYKTTLNIYSDFCAGRKRHGVKSGGRRVRSL
jgi:hypothetical protein